MTVIEREAVVTERERRASVLEAAALEIEVRGWCQGIACNDAGAVCARGGIGFAVWNSPGTLSPEISELWGCEVRLADWNDKPERTADEVTFLLRWRAAEIRDGL